MKESPKIVSHTVAFLFRLLSTKLLDHRSRRKKKDASGRVSNRNRTSFRIMIYYTGTVQEQYHRNYTIICTTRESTFLSYDKWHNGGHVTHTTKHMRRPVAQIPYTFQSADSLRTKLYRSDPEEHYFSCIPHKPTYIDAISKKLLNGNPKKRWTTLEANVPVSYLTLSYWILTNTKNTSARSPSWDTRPNGNRETNSFYDLTTVSLSISNIPLGGFDSLLYVYLRSVKRSEADANSNTFKWFQNDTFSIHRTP